MVVRLENSLLCVEIQEKGAELYSIYGKKSQMEYLYQPDGIHWDKQSPLLFPFIGRLKNQEYYYQGQTYKMGKHGFAKNYDFRVTEQKANTVVFELTSEDVVEESFPFEFKLQVLYSLEDNKVRVGFRVDAGKSELYFNIGGHPAFYIPVDSQGNFDEYRLKIECGHSLERLLLDGPYLSTQVPVAFPEQDFQLQHELFVDDALIFPTEGATVLTLYSPKNARIIRFSYEKFPYVGIWTMTNQAPFICIEPWDGLPDAMNSNQRLEDKQAIRYLQPYQLYQNSYEIEVSESILN